MSARLRASGRNFNAPRTSERSLDDLLAVATGHDVELLMYARRGCCFNYPQSAIRRFTERFWETTVCPYASKTQEATQKLEVEAVAIKAVTAQGEDKNG